MGLPGLCQVTLGGSPGAQVGLTPAEVGQSDLNGGDISTMGSTKPLIGSGGHDIISSTPPPPQIHIHCITPHDACPMWRRGLGTA